MELRRTTILQRVPLRVFLTIFNDFEGGDEEGGDDAEKPPEFEPRGTGVNKNVYWVTDNVLGKWVKLPDLLPKDIIATRNIKVSFSGNLER